jgi:hypothetical protein
MFRFSRGSIGDSTGWEAVVAAVSVRYRGDTAFVKPHGDKKKV